MEEGKGGAKWAEGVRKPPVAPKRSRGVSERTTPPRSGRNFKFSCDLQVNIGGSRLCGENHLYPGCLAF